MTSQKWTQREIDFLKENYQFYKTKKLAQMLNRDYCSTKRKVKKYILDVNEHSELPYGFKKIEFSPLHAINCEGVIINIRTRKTLKPCTTHKSGYAYICLGGKNSYRVHRLVAQYFIPNPENKPQVNHKDGNRFNNIYTNLEWCTQKENQDHAIKTGLWDNISEKISKRQTGETNSCAKLKKVDVLQIYQDLHSGVKVGELAKKYNVNSSAISGIKSGKNWKHLYHIYLEDSTTRTAVRTSQAIGDGNGEQPNG